MSNKIYSTRELIARFTDALENGYTTLSQKEILEIYLGIIEIDKDEQIIKLIKACRLAFNHIPTIFNATTHDESTLMEVKDRLKEALRE